ncbi:sugar ABC transporter ATP-binding protein [Micrococcales bacterium 31B]|nr:sugar ABC transporter ATP-binding protein [Micrococcales bacterium 31B]
MVNQPHRVPGGNSGEPELLTIRDLTKRFGATQALSGVDFDLRLGSIHALLGQNGAGKSTLIKILAGVHPASGGSIQVNGYDLADPLARTYLTFIHQDLGLVEWMSVAENVALQAGYQRRAGLIDWRAVRVAAAEALDIVAPHINPNAPISDLTRADRSLVAIARALCTQAKIIVLDEPTASLPAKDSQRLFTVLQALRDRGHGLIYVSHRLDEVFALCDTYTVLRDGRLISTGEMHAVKPEQLILDIVGKKPVQYANQGQVRDAPIKLAARQFSTGSIGPLDFTVHAGEVVGMIGLTGAGHLETGRTIAGILPLQGGTLDLNGAPYTPRSPQHAVAAKVPFVTSNRLEEGCAPELSLTENIFANLASRGRSGLSWLKPRAERAAAQRIVEHFGVRPANADAPIASLSGGNQQKVLIGRWLSLAQEVLVLEEPTAGVDVGAKADIYTLLNESLREGLAVVLVSSDFEEVAQVCHRALVFVDGRIARELSGPTLTVASLTEAASGATALAT